MKVEDQGSQLIINLDDSLYLRYIKKEEMLCVHKILMDGEPDTEFNTVHITGEDEIHLELETLDELKKFNQGLDLLISYLEK